MEQEGMLGGKPTVSLLGWVHGNMNFPAVRCHFYFEYIKLYILYGF